MTFFVARWSAEDAERVSALPTVSASSMDNRALGSEVVLEGLLSSRNPPLMRNFVAYYREEFQRFDEENGEEWRRDETVAPALLVGEGQALAQIAANYSQRSYHERWQEPGPLRYSRGEGTKRYSGLVNGNPIIAVGVIQAGVEGPELRAEFVFAGDKAAFIAEREGTATFTAWFGLLFMLVGGFILLFGFWQPIRRMLFGF